MKKRTSKMSRRIVSLLMSIVLTLTLVTPAAFAAEVVDGSSTTIVEGNANPADPAPGEDSENNEDKNTEDGKDEQPTEPRDEDKNPDEDNGDDASKPDGDSKDKENPDGENKDEENKDEQPTEDENNGEDDISLLNDENGTDVWDGTTDTSWYNYEQTTTFEISTAEQLAGLAQLVNGGTNFSGKTIKLMADIQLNELDENGMPTAAEGKTEPSQWTPIGTSQKKFAGTFDGDGHTIAGLYINDTAAVYNAYKGLFGNITASAKVQNLVVTGDVMAKSANNTAPQYVGGIVGFNDGTVQNCGFQGSVSASKKNSAPSTNNNGGVVGYGKATNCWYFRKTGTFKLGVCGGTPTNCYHNVSGNSKGTYYEDKAFGDGTVASLLNSGLTEGCKAWKAVVGGDYPSFLGENEKLVVLEKYLPISAAVMSIKDCTESFIVVSSGTTVTLVSTGTVWYSLDGKNWDSFSGERSIQINATEQTVRIYYAASEAETTAGDWYNKNSGTEKDPYQISNAAELAFFASLVNAGNNFAKKYVKLNNEITLNKEANWTPIGDASHAFVGTFDGNGCSVKNLYINNAAQYQGLFGNVGAGGMVKNLIVTGTVTAARQAKVGGIVAYGAYNSIVQNCGFYGVVTAGAYQTGGVMGSGNAQNCWYFRTASGEDVAALGVGGTPTDCYHNVSGNSNGTYIAGNFAATVANKLNVEAFKDTTLLLWKAGADGYPVFDAAADRDNMVPVTLETYVKTSSVAGKIEISVQGSEPLMAYLAKKGDSITLKLVENYPDDGDKIYYTPDKDKHSSDEIVEITAAGVTYTVPKELAEGQTSVTLYYGTTEEFNAVEGVNAWYYNGTNKITNEAELRFLAALVNDKHVDFSGRTAISLGDDIALTETWMPIGTADHPFRGVFHGNGHTISGLKVEGEHANAGLFGVVEGTVDMVNLRDGKVSSAAEGANVGGIAGCIRGESKAAKVESCDSNVEVIAAGKNANAGGIAGTIVGNGSLKYSICTGKVTATGENAVAGGLVGRITDTEKYSGTVQGGYFYNETQKDFPAIAVKSEKSKIAYCFYLADKSTYDKKDTKAGVTSGGAADIGDTGARTKDEFLFGRVLWELGKASSSNVFGVNKTLATDDFMLPKLFVTGMISARAVYQLSLTKTGGETTELVILTSGNGAQTLTNGDTQYVYGASGTAVTLDSSSIPDGRMAIYTPNEPKTISYSDKEYTYTVGKAHAEDTSWYTKNPDAEKFTITNVDQLFGFAKLIEEGIDFKAQTVALGADIDLSGYDWIPLDKDGYFAGTFDGNRHTISNMSVTAANSYGQAGLFSTLYCGTVQNLTVTGTINLENCSGELRIGGIVGYLGGTIKNCTNRVNIEVNGGTGTIYVGGIVGEGDYESAEISNCLNTGSITVVNANCVVGGIVGGGAKVNTCWNTGKVTASAPEAGQVYVGGIAALVTSVPVVNCFNSGVVLVTGQSDDGACVVGGIAGYVDEDEGNVHNSYNIGGVTGPEGNIYGIASANVTNCYYICKLNGADGAVYVRSSASETETEQGQNIIITATEDGKTTYAVDGVELKQLLNSNRDGSQGGCQWINKTTAPYNPVHIYRWDGSFEDGVENVVTLIYDPGTGRGSQQLDQIMREGDNVVVFELKDPVVLGFAGKNSRFASWNEQADGKGTSYAPSHRLSVPVGTDSITLYAQWTPFWEGEGTQNSPYELSNKDEFMLMDDKDAVIDSNTYFALKNNIDMGNYEPFGFTGNLDGQNHSIAINIDSANSNAGLFSAVSCGHGSITIKNLTITGNVQARQYAGGLAGRIRGMVALENLTTSVNVSVSFDHSRGAAGGLCGTYNATALTVKNCKNEGSISGAAAGGFVGDSNGTAAVQFYNCVNTGNITGGNTAAGFVAIYHLAYNLTSSFEGCDNGGAVTATAGRAAGIAITSTGNKVTNCTNRGTISGDIAAGILGTGGAVRCTNTGTINGVACAAGIVANFNGVGKNIVTSFCANFGEVTATAGNGAAKPAYGIAMTGTIENCFTYNATKHVPVAGTTSKTTVVTNSYYLANSKDEFPSTMGGEYATLADFTSGKVAWGVGGKGEGSQGGTDQDAKLGWWKQDKDDKYPTLLDNPDMSKRYYRTDVDCGTGGEVELTRNASSAVKEISSKEAVYGPAGTSVTIKATPKDNTFGLKSLTWTHNGQTDVLPAKGTTNIVMPAESNVTIHAEFASVGPGGNGGYYYGGSGDGTGTGDKDDEGLQDGLNMDVEYDIKGLVLGAYAEWGSNGGNKSFQKWLEENPNVVRALLTNSLDNMATAAVGKKTDEAKDLAALLLASLNEHTGVDGKDGDTIAKALQKYIDSGSEEVFSAWLTGGGGMASGTYESIYGQYASSLAALADRLYSKWEASGTSMTFPVWLDSQQVSMDSLSENADEPDTDNTNDPQTSDAPEDVPDGQDTEGGASGNSVWEVIGTVVRENPIIVWSIVAVVAALVIVGAVRRYHKVKRDERDDVASKK